MADGLAVEAEGLERIFKGGIRAVNGVDLAVARGEVYGFLGPNGAGKSTTVRMLATLLTPTGGRASVAGHDLVGDPDGGPAQHRRGPPGRGDRPLHDRPRAAAPAGRAARLRPRGGPAARGGAARARGPGRRGRPPRRHVLRRHAAPARPRARPGPRAGGALPGRADDRPRPDLAPDPLGRGPPPQRGRRDGLPDHPVPGGGRPARRAGSGSSTAAGSWPRGRPPRSRPRWATPRSTSASPTRPTTPAARACSRPSARSCPAGPSAVAVRLPGGASAVAGVVRALDEAGIAATGLDLAQPTLDDVFVAKTGRRLEAETAEEGAAAPRRRVRTTVVQTAALARRAVIGTLRTPQALVPGLFFPLVLMAIFTASFAGAPGAIPGFPPVRELPRLRPGGGDPPGHPDRRHHRRLRLRAGHRGRVLRPAGGVAGLAHGDPGGPPGRRGRDRDGPDAPVPGASAIAFGARVEGGLAGVLVLLVLAAPAVGRDQRAGGVPGPALRLGRGRPGHLPPLLRPALLLVGVLPARDHDRLVQGRGRRSTRSRTWWRRCATR